MNFFLDNTFAPKLGPALALLAERDDHTVVHLMDRFRGDTDDLEWISAVGRWPEAWVILSGDRRIATNPQRLAALRSSRRTAFFMPSNYPRLPHWDQAWQLVKWFPAIAGKAGTASVQRIYEVKSNGSILEMRLRSR
ncbi:MAG: hypothetical protein HY899_05445 [Deltaproteobacteria bacterium]|nr:hypothetical protein [Deltaproteobacteria bacterium]